MRRLSLLALAPVLMAQLAQNPSPMVEHTRPHTRLPQQTPPGARHTLEIGTLYIPPKLNVKQPLTLLIFFHGGNWVPEVAAAKNRIAVISVQVGEGSGVYSRAFEDPQRFENLLSETQTKAGRKIGKVILGGWSAGCGAVRQLLRTPAIYARVSSVLCIDGMHADYVSGHPGPMESEIAEANVDIWLPLAKDAIARKKRFVITHTELFPGTYASTTETADYLLHQLELKVKPVLRTGPMGTQQLGETRAGYLLIAGYAGNSAPDHVDQLHSLPEYLKWVK